MASILDFLSTAKGKEFIRKSGDEINESPEKVENALSMALPMILGGIKKNVSTPQGAERLHQELGKEKHDGSVLDQIESGSIATMVGEGSGILNHVFGSGESKVVEAVSSAVGMDASKVSRLLKMAAPVIMGLLGKQKRNENSDNISGMVGSLLGNNSAHDQSLLETLMDSDKGGNIASDMAGKLLGGRNKSKGVGGFFKG